MFCRIAITTIAISIAHHVVIPGYRSKLERKLEKYPANAGLEPTTSALHCSNLYVKSIQALRSELTDKSIAMRSILLSKRSPIRPLQVLVWCQEPTDTSKQPIRTPYLGHVTRKQPIRDQYFLIRSVPASYLNEMINTLKLACFTFILICATLQFLNYHILQEPIDTSKQPIRTRYLGHVTGY
eukprot:sb/3471521/